MGAYSNKTLKNTLLDSEEERQSITNKLFQKKVKKNATFQFVDNRPEAIEQQKQIDAIQNASNTHTIQKKENNTGLPENLKSGIENLSGYAMDDVKVHYNSNKPAQLNAHAYAQGSEIHLASGQEKHLPHEAWHVVQQKQGRVQPTMQMKGKVNVNDDAGLEKEADVMGAKSANTHHMRNINLKNTFVCGGSLQARWVNTGGPNLLWEKPLEGIQWYYVNEGEKIGEMFYRITNMDVIPEPLREAYAANAGKPMPREYFVEGSESGNEHAEEDSSIITEGDHTKELLTNSLEHRVPAQILGQMSLHELEVEHAKHVYAQGSLTAKPSMKYSPIGNTIPGTTTQIDEMRKARVTDPSEENSKDYQTKMSAKTEKKLMVALMPKLEELTQFIRLTNYYDGDSEASIRDTGLLQSKNRRILKAGGKDVTNKSGKLDDELGNTDHVFFFAEYEDEQRGQAPFRNTRFGGDAKTGDAILNQKAELDGSERRVSFPLNQVRQEGVHGYLGDLNSMPGGINPAEHVFSGAPLHDTQADMEPLPGTHLLMDLLRQRFKQSNFPGKKDEDKMIKDLQALTMFDFYTFLFRKHPKNNKKGATEVNPQILVPGSVPLYTERVRFDKP